MNRASRQLGWSVFLGIVACSRPAPIDPPASASTSTSTPSSTSPSTSTATSTSTPTSTSTSLVTARPYSSLTPRSYSPSSPSPLVLVLHGYGGTGRWQAEYFGLLELAESKGFLVAFPDGTPDHEGKRFWNATDACCDFDHRAPNDVAYLGAILDDMQARFNVDRKRVYAIGLSNGGFMSHRLACDLSPRIAAIVSLAGAQWGDAARCSPTEPVSIVEAHENADPIIRPDGGVVFSRPNMAGYPSVTKTIATWATKNGCTGALATVKGGALDLNARVDGTDTTIARYGGCPVGGAVEFWSMHGGAHVPKLERGERGWSDTVYAFFMAHPKP